MRAQEEELTRDDAGGVRGRMTAEERRENILDAAARVFAARGYHAASVAEIADAAGISKPVIYNHFASKLDLHRASFQHHSERLLATAASFGQTGTLEERFRDLVRGMFAFAHANPHAWQFLLGDSSDPETAELQRQLREVGTQQSAARLLETADYQPRGRLSRRAAATAHAELVRSAVDGLITWSLHHENASRTALADTAKDLIWSGIRSALTAPASRRNN